VPLMLPVLTLAQGPFRVLATVGTLAVAPFAPVLFYDLNLGRLVNLNIFLLFLFLSFPFLSFPFLSFPFLSFFSQAIDYCTNGGNDCAAVGSVCTFTGPATYSCSCAANYTGTGTVCNRIVPSLFPLKIPF